MSATATEQNTQVRIATIGSVDDGKSTLIGRLLHDSKGIFEDQLSAVSKASRRYGDGSFNLALLTDGLRAEREQGITIDVAYRYFATPKRSFVLADTPGHAQFTRNMVTGASVSDIAIVLVDARHGVVEQTRRHVSIAALLGVSHLILAVNKMDLVAWSETSFDEVVTDVAGILSTLESSVPLHAIPICATDGQNVVERGPEASWYEGPSVLDLLETLDVAPAATVGARLAVQWTLREHGGSDYRGYSGRLEGGVLRVGDAVTVHPKGNTSVVTGLTRAGTPTDIAVPGDAIAIELADDLDVGKFDVIVASGATQPIDTTDIIADVCWLVETELNVGDNLIVRHPSGEANGKVVKIIHRLDLDTLKNSSADKLTLNDIARVEIKLQTPLVVDAYSANRAGGSAIAIDPVTNATMGALMVVGQGEEQAQANVTVVAGASTAAEPQGKVRSLLRGFFTLKINEQ
jgi:sulfate adenylyltransferase large subunit